jgi:hypothetical protein
MSIHGCPVSIVNSSLLLFCISTVACQSPSSVTPTDEAEPTWTFESITWRGKDAGKVFSVSAESLRHYETRIEGTNLNFSYETSNGTIAGAAKSSEGPATFQRINFHQLTVRAEGLGTFTSKSGILETQTPKLTLSDVEATLADPPMRVSTGSARLSLDEKEQVTLETSELEGYLPASESAKP